MVYSDLKELKAVLELDPDDKSEDKKLNFVLKWTSEWMEELLGRDLSRKARTQYYDGTGTQRLLLRNRPVLTTPTIECFVDDTGRWGQGSDPFASATQLTWGTDFGLRIDQDDGTSRSGILERFGTYWTRPRSRQPGLLAPFLGKGQGNVKVTYTAGYTVDTLPEPIRMACNFLAMRLNYVLPLGLELSSENYEDRSISLAAERKDYLLSLVKPMLWNYRNWKW